MQINIGDKFYSPNKTVCVVLEVLTQSCLIGTENNDGSITAKSWFTFTEMNDPVCFTRLNLSELDQDN
jgi:hypothetical protein